MAIKRDDRWGAAGTRRRQGSLCVSFLVALLAVLGALLAVSGAPAHAHLDRAEPEPGSSIPASPKRVDLWFNQELFREAGANVIDVYADDGTRVDTGDALLNDDDRRHLSVGLQPDLAPGEYRVAWRNLSAVDRDANEGEFSFTVDPAAAGPSPPTTPAAESGEAREESGNGGGWLLIAVFGALALGVVVAATFALRFLRSSQEP